MIEKINTNDFWNNSLSRGLPLIGTIVTDDNGEPLNGKKTMADNSVINFNKGLINNDGDKPAIEYEHGGVEFWENGYPNGTPAIISEFGTHEEDWVDGILVQIRNEYEVEEED